MQAHDAYKIIHVPKLQFSEIYPVLAIKRMLKYYGSKIPVTSVKLRNVLTSVDKQMHLNPKVYGFHCFRRSGVTLALELNVRLENIKIHGHWKSDAVWSYLSDTPKAASVVASAFQQHIK